MEIKSIDIKLCVCNNGQIPGVAKNPRKWSKKDVEALEASIQETPELLAIRGLVVYPHMGKYVVIGGNMRLAACRNLGHTEVPCIIMPEDTPVLTIRKVAMADNGSHCSWDWDVLANEYDEELLKKAYVIPWVDDLAPIEEEESVGEVDVASFTDTIKLTFKLSPADKVRVEKALSGFHSEKNKALMLALGLDTD